MDKINDYDSSNIDSDLEETHIELPNVNKNQAQKNLNFKKKKARLILKKKTEGSKNFKTSALSEHTLTKDHTDITNLKVARAKLIKVSNNSVDKAQNHVGALMKIIFWMAENDILLNKLSEIVKLCRILEYPQLISASNTITYENNVSGHEMLSAISNSIEETIWKELDKAIAFGIMVDESTDISCEPYLVIYIKYCLHGKIKIHFLKLLQLKSLTNKLMSFASDKASVMLGKSTGVASRIKERNECLFITHCIAHRLALACNTAEKKVDFCKHIEYIIKSTYKHPILKIKQIFEVHWLSWYEAVKNLCLSIEPLMDTLLETMTTTNNNIQRQNFIFLYTEICDWKLLAFLHFLWDILGYLTTLSKIFQQKKIQISNIDPIIELTLRKIQQEFLDYDEDGRLLLGKNLNRFLSNTTAKDNYNIGTHQLTQNENYEADLIVDISSFASAVITEIQERFPDRPLFNSMKIFDHTNWPNGREELIKYGEKELNIYQNFTRRKLVIFLKSGIIYFIPFSSVDCKHRFLKQNLIKTDLRNSLNNETLHFWMMVGFEEKDLSEFNFTRALQIWNSACKRRI
ncbi:zinc finger protein 862-like [Rhizophagus clarus]|uniref:Zinc finger protein 862-like n=1 Tax=Rhizophagus clarus TaxID=94130 RepID=A0A8H3KTC2_9GLOM|nr:zinc finger protein 862-like [Rhizophagus clarus]